MIVFVSLFLITDVEILSAILVFPPFYYCESSFCHVVLLLLTYCARTCLFITDHWCRDFICAYFRRANGAAELCVDICVCVAVSWLRCVCRMHACTNWPLISAVSLVHFSCALLLFFSTFIHSTPDIFFLFVSMALFLLLCLLHAHLYKLLIQLLFYITPARFFISFLLICVFAFSPSFFRALEFFFI